MSTLEKEKKYYCVNIQTANNTQKKFSYILYTFESSTNIHLLFVKGLMLKKECEMQPKFLATISLLRS